ncbi:mucin-like protein [Bombyx mandarina]|uniref:Mucin-like protein n=1 Tax=Bombyx mandarina TaxID=7092 RepID=A0A6J2KF20_BOMMA|nr:mucin-like protein [Bombyx mandarina]
MGPNTIDIIAAFTLNFLQYVTSDHILPCNVTAIEPCKGKNEVCVQKTLQCVCEKGFIRVGDDCEEPSDDTGGPHGATAAIVSIFTIALIVCGLVLVVRKYNLIEYMRQKINQRRTNDVMYEDVMIGNDDPPLSP